LESSSAKEKRQEKQAKKLAEKAVGLLQNAKNRYYAEPLISVWSEYYDYSNPLREPRKTSC